MGENFHPPNLFAGKCSFKKIDVLYVPTDEHIFTCDLLPEEFCRLWAFK